MRSLSGRAGSRGAAVALSLLALAACSSVPDTAPVVVTPSSGSGSVSSSASFMTSPVTDAPVATTSAAPTATATTPTVAITPSATASTTPDPGAAESTATTTPLIERPGTGTVVYRGTTYVMPSEETTKTLATAATISIQAREDLKRDARDVIKSLVRSFKFSDRAQMDPLKDWSVELNRNFVDPYRSRFSESLDLLRSSGIHAVGHIAITGEVTELGEDVAEIEACVDIRYTDLVDSSGRSVASGESSEHNSRFEETVFMVRSDGEWKISDTAERRASKC